MLVNESCAIDAHADAMMQRVWRGKDIHVHVSQLTACPVSGKVVTNILYVASVADGCSTLHCSRRQRFDVILSGRESFVIGTTDSLCEVIQVLN